jgi:peptidoglycan-N-acetylglucosamine deacetylase
MPRAPDMSKVFSTISRAARDLARPFVGTITHVSTRDPVAALTFDDGPEPTFTPRLLDVLHHHGARATFFMVGASAQRHPALLERVAAAGHAIGNHSWDHPSFPCLSSRERRNQVRACGRALAPYGLPLFRSPGGHQSPRSVLDVRSLRFQPIGWTIDPQDYTERTADEIAGQILQDIHPGSIIVLHDAIFHQPHSDRSATIDAVDRVLSRAAGYRFLTIPALLRHGRPCRIHSFWHPVAPPG